MFCITKYTIFSLSDPLFEIFEVPTFFLIDMQLFLQKCHLHLLNQKLQHFEFFSKCDDTTDVNLRKDFSVLSVDVCLICFLNLFGGLHGMSDKESRDETGDIDFRSSSDEISLAGEDLECAKGNISLLF